VLEVVDALGVDRFSVVGASMGGSVGMKVAALAADRLVAVVMVDIAGRVDPGVVPVIAELLAEADAVDLRRWPRTVPRSRFGIPTPAGHT
jgi:pimeloyl-ACP methyl ester carboxylesterase